MTKFNKHYLCATPLALAMVMAAQPAFASDGNDTAENAAATAEESAENSAAAQAAQEKIREENIIVVTASKRAENLQEVPISVSAIGGDSLQKSRLVKTDDLVTKVANLQMTSTVGDNTPIFSLRGISMSDYSLNQSSPVATYYDEVYKGNFALLGVALFDMERVEVLRGPQGTLYGKNTIGGAVNFISRAPEIGENSGYVNFGYGNYNRFDANGAINLALGDTAALRVAGTFSRADGWFKNQLPGQPDLASTREYGVRAQLYWEPSDSFDLTLMGSTSLQNPRNYGIFAQPQATIRAGLKDDEIEANVTERRRARTYSVALKANWDISDTMTITSITSYDDGSLSFKEDTDGIGIKFLEIPYEDEAEQFAQDLRLTSNFGGPFEFILGLYYNREKVYNASTLEVGNDFDLTGDNVVDNADCLEGLTNADPSDDLLACQFSNSFTQIKNSYAIYSDMSYEFNDNLTLRGGIRYTHDKGTQNDFQADLLGADGVYLDTFIPNTDTKYSVDNISGKIGLDYKFDNGNMVYANYSRGYRAPSFNAQAFFDPSEVNVAKAEKVNSYEIGAKTQIGYDVTLNLAAFYIDYRNQQFINVDPATAAQTLLNIPKSGILGAEAELTARAADWLDIQFGLGLLDTDIKRGVVSGTDVSGNRLSNAPALTMNASLNFTIFDDDKGKLSFVPEVSYATNQYFEVVNINRLRQGDYALLGGHIDYETPDGNWNVSLWAKNLTDKFYFTSRVDLLSGFGYDYNHRGTPITYGITVGASY